MTKSVAFISGKGGSGKTTLALSIASMFSECGLKVLLVDCDLATNGATYFYETKLEKRDENICSFADILYNNSTKIKPMFIADNFYFIPSVSSIKRYQRYIRIINDIKYGINERFETFYRSVSKEFDIVLFDCQAGYTDELDLILSHSNFNLAVMEADAISSAAMRSLYLKIGNIINGRKIFQTFNKVSAEEYEIYSKISGGTVFTNIEAVIFDWSIRKAFAVSSIPNLNNTDIKFGEQIFNICNVIANSLFDNSELKKKLEDYRLRIQIKQLEKQKERKEHELMMKKLHRKGVSSGYIMFFTIITLSIIAIIFLNVYFLLWRNYDWSFIVAITMSVFTIMVTCMNMYFFIKQSNQKNRDTLILQEEIESIDKSINGAKSKLDSTKK